jgi:hypothetical protein
MYDALDHLLEPGWAATGDRRNLPWMQVFCRERERADELYSQAISLNAYPRKSAYSSASILSTSEAIPTRSTTSKD